MLAVPSVVLAEDTLVGKQLLMRAQIIERAQAQGCHLHIDEGEQIAETLGMSRSEMKDVARHMLAAGEAGGKGAILTLSTELCGKTPDPLPEPEPQDTSGNPMGLPGGPTPMNAPQEAFVAFMEQIGCALDWDVAEEALTGAGFEYGIMEVLLYDFIHEGIVEEQGETLILTQGECT
ncbi:hypothetical protein RXV86_16685 [Alisedimentitalea sp. MJ-SS2]|uniref:hypothetical protein n=1 Tax=Aliisedimentitalea sp. MJ-SS2 TaxID=3049795 RepID=UPI00291506F2|nr:hypothetical protein [Alisedimentitalea sp. MJ-SS2]MDU8929032.1 hypothetical protein [Alisedimentitalea sp. MJ-SS2]